MNAIKKSNESECKKKLMHNVQYYTNVLKKLSKGKNYTMQEGLSESSAIRSDGSWDTRTGGWTSKLN
jgi:hypothetical protein